MTRLTGLTSFVVNQTPREPTDGMKLSWLETKLNLGLGKLVPNLKLQTPHYKFPYRHVMYDVGIESVLISRSLRATLRYQKERVPVVVGPFANEFSELLELFRLFCKATVYAPYMK